MVLVLASIAGAPRALHAQSTSATVTGTVVDRTGAVLPNAEIVIANVDTSMARRAISQRDGSFTVTTLPPGTYTLTATLAGFAATTVSDIELNVNDRVSVRLELAVATIDEGVTVTSSPRHLSELPAVSTVIDRQFVENLPLNGRSLQSLLELTPGVVPTPVIDSATTGGQFSVNGQRSSANYFMVDGVSANVGVTGGNATLPGQSGAGQLPGFTSLGGTNGLVPVDALQEFRVHTSSYAPEFGRVSGGQISMITRAGTNALHGSAFEYFRHDALDARDWITNYRGLAKPELRQHDFGGVLGGPVVRNRTFFFGSYEGLRLRQPRSTLVQVPSLQARRTARPELQPYLDALPIPNGPDTAPGFAEFAASFSDPSQVDSTGLRLDHNLRPQVHLFGRVSHAPSWSEVRSGSLSYTTTTHRRNTSATVGATWILSNRIVHDIRANYSRATAPFAQQPDTFGGATPPPPSVFELGRSPQDGYYAFSINGGGNWGWGLGTDYRQHQINVVDALTISRGAHEMKLGLDFRRIETRFSDGSFGFQTIRFDVGDLPLGRANAFQTYLRDPRKLAAAFDAFSLYAQDTWKPLRRLTITGGLRWEVVPAPHATTGDEAVTLTNLDDPYGGRVDVAPRGTRLWETRYNNVAPRVGGSYLLSQRDGGELVIRGGGGVFYDLGFGQVSNAYATYPFAASRIVSGPAFPLPQDAVTPPRLVEDAPQSIWVMDPRAVLPLTYQWNISAEQALGARQTVTIGYVGAAGRKLLKLDRYNLRLVEWPTAPTPTSVGVNRNRGHSDYHGLQLQFQRRLTRGIQAIASYTYGQSRDTSSSDNAANIPAERLSPEVDYGYSDYDVRHVFTTAVTMHMPALSPGGLWRVLAREWGLDLMLRARSATPLQMSTTVPFPPDMQIARPNLVPGEPLWIEDPAVPGGRYLNRRAFSIPPPNTQGNVTRGSIRGFRVSQLDLVLRRDFALTDGLRLQLRAELFNALNTPMFQNPSGSLSNANFGVATQILSRGFGGINALYQTGGPRSTQLALKLVF